MDPEVTAAQPDYRMSLALERTYLAHVRTGLALLAGGVGLAGALPHAGGEELRRVLAVLLVLVGAAVLGTARPRWAAVDRAMRCGAPLPRSRTVQLLAPVLVPLAVVAVVVVLVV